MMVEEYARKTMTRFLSVQIDGGVVKSVLCWARVWQRITFEA